MENKGIKAQKQKNRYSHVWLISRGVDTDMGIQNNSNEAIPVISNFSNTTASLHMIPSSNHKSLSKLEIFKYNS